MQGFRNVDDAINNGSLRNQDYLRWFMLVVPVYFFILAAWFIRPLSVSNISLAYVAPLTFITGILLLNVSKSELVNLLMRFKFELPLALVMGLLSILSLINSDEPVRILRILFPAMLPVLLVIQLIALRSISPQSVERLPRHFLITGFLFACIPLLVSQFSGGVYNYVYEGKYRYQGLFDHESQLSVMVAVMVPLVIGEIAVSKTTLARWIWMALLIMTFYTSVRIGSKTALLLSVGFGLFFYFIAHARVQSVLKNIFLAMLILVLMVFLGIFGTAIISSIDPTTGAKIEQIFQGGVENYSTIQSRTLLWTEAIRVGKQHWLIGTGAGESVLGYNHAHNLILDYFHGIGIFGAFAVAALCLCILWRTFNKTLYVMLSKSVTALDIRILACLSGATIYVLCNQLSNSFGPATISALWMLYIPAVLSEPAKGAKSGPSLSPSHVR
ncbi:MAG: O-antigen ligase family protein [bacterium]